MLSITSVGEVNIQWCSGFRQHDKMEDDRETEADKSAFCILVNSSIH